MLRQILISVAVLVIAFVGWVMFVPGSAQTLSNLGVNLPFGPATDKAEAAQPAAGATPRAGGQGGGQQAGGRRQGGFRGNQTTVVVTAPVTLATINDSLTAIGEGVATRSVTVTSPSGGTLEEILVSPGDVVKAGDPIGHLDAEAEQIAFDKANLDAKDAANTLSRNIELAKTNSVSAVAVNTAQLAADQANLGLRNAQLALKRRTISTPIGGTVGLMQVTQGNYVSSNSAVTTVDDTSDILVTFWVPERYASAITLGMPVEASAVALPGQVIAGKVSAVDNRIDSASRTLQVQARIPNESQNMRAGMSFSVTMKFPGQKFPAVNPLSIQWSADGSYVWTIADGKSKKIMAKIIQRNSDGVLVEGDLKEGDPIITEGVLQLQEGTAVTLLSERQAGAGNAANAPATNASSPAATSPAATSPAPDAATGQRRHRPAADVAQPGTGAAPAATPVTPSN